MDILLIEGCDYQGYPVGGQLSFARQLMKSFCGRLGLVGISTDKTPVGRWLRKEFNGSHFPFFAVGHREPISEKPLVPARLQFYLQLKRYRKQIMTAGYENVFIQAPETLLAVHSWKWENISYRFAGVENPLVSPRYKWGTVLANVFEQRLFKVLAKADVILACADAESICNLKKRGEKLLENITLNKFPTRVDTECFHPFPQRKARLELNIPQDIPVIVNCGRLNNVKGWELIMKSFYEFIKKSPQSYLYFVGDGECRPAIEAMITELNLQGKVGITGYVSPELVSLYLNSSDLCVVGSFKEGWSLAMLEALACGKAVVSTNVSGAKELIVQGVNGFVVEHRDPHLFSEMMLKSLSLPNVSSTSLNIVSPYALHNLAQDLGNLWSPFSDVNKKNPVNCK